MLYKDNALKGGDFYFYAFNLYKGRSRVAQTNHFLIYLRVKILLLVVGKTTQDFVKQGTEEFISRLKHYISFEMQTLPELKNTKNISSEQLKTKEGERILKVVQPGDQVVLLDETGKEYSSVAFAEYLEKKTRTVSKRLIFVIGGAYGFSSDVYETAREKIALSRMTFSHQMIRLIFVEQLYRALTILNNEPYHHETRM